MERDVSTVFGPGRSSWEYVFLVLGMLAIGFGVRYGLPYFEKDDPSWAVRYAVIQCNEEGEQELERFKTEEEAEADIVARLEKRDQPQSQFYVREVYMETNHGSVP